MGAGEPYIARLDVLGKEPAADRAKARRSLAYLGHLSDIHIIDAQSPGRLEPLIAVSPTFIDASRPQDTMSVQVLSQMVSSVANARTSPLTGAPIAAVLSTGDNADSRNQLELEWCIKTMDGASVIPNSGAAGIYQGVQVWEEATYVYNPANPGLSEYGPHGFPTIPEMLTSAVSQNVKSVGLPVPWYTTYGNHDTLFMGNIQVDVSLQAWAVGNKKAALWPAAARNMLNGWSTNTSVFNQFSNHLRNALGLESGVHEVTADPQRKLFSQLEFMQAHFNSPPIPGPVGHGFTQANLDTGETWWQADITPYLRVFGLDTCNQIAGADGAVPADQFNWLQAQLAQVQQDGKLAIICTHHNSYTLENVAAPAIGPHQQLYHADEFIAMLHQYPNMIAWINGHTHINTITAHAQPGGKGFWEITTASCIDFPQQQQLIEVVDNRDGTLSLFTTTIDHDSAPGWENGDFSQKGLASLSREIASNAWEFEPLPHSGSPLDRNCELLMQAPFDLSKISEAELDKAHATQTARLVAYRGKAPA